MVVLLYGTLYSTSSQFNDLTQKKNIYKKKQTHFIISAWLELFFKKKDNNHNRFNGQLSFVMLFVGFDGRSGRSNIFPLSFFFMEGTGVIFRF